MSIFSYLKNIIQTINKTIKAQAIPTTVFKAFLATRIKPTIDKKQIANTTKNFKKPGKFRNGFKII